jgi:hypothetical protein
MSKPSNIQSRYEPGQEDILKRDTLKHWRECYRDADYFQVENEEKEPGFPDVISLCSDETYALYEFKVSNYDDWITFEKSQIVFYHRHPSLIIYIAAWSVPQQRLVLLTSGDINAKRSLRYKLPRIYP